jgi:hypothetical protein
MKLFLRLMRHHAIKSYVEEKFRSGHPQLQLHALFLRYLSPVPWVVPGADLNAVAKR